MSQISKETGDKIVGDLKDFITFTSLVLNGDDKPDCVNETIDINGVQLSKDPIPVFFNFNHSLILGEAILNKKDNKIFANIKITKKAYKECFVDTYPCIGGEIFKKENNEIKDFKIEEISLSPNGNADSRIKTLREQIENKNG